MEYRQSRHSGFVAGLLVVLYCPDIEYGTDAATKVFAFLGVYPVVILPWVAAAVMTC
jgi:hypothetical protein